MHTFSLSSPRNLAQAQLFLSPSTALEQSRLQTKPRSRTRPISLYDSISISSYLVLQGGGEPSSIWAEDQLPETAAGTALAALRQMLAGGINTDVTINTSDGGAAAHRAVLAARSPVFNSMFSHDLREKELAVIEITDMSSAACWAFLRYLYGGVPPAEFTAHRLSLLRAADKYDVSDLRQACEDSLCEDIDGDNVLERLQTAHLYRLPLLKGSCMRYLVNFGRICDLHEEFNAFLMTADRELIWEIFHDVLGAWKGH